MKKQISFPELIEVKIKKKISTLQIEKKEFGDHLETLPLDNKVDI